MTAIGRLHELWEASETLSEIRGRKDGVRYAVLDFEFGRHVLHLACDLDTDTVLVSVDATPSEHPTASDPLLDDLIGTQLEHAWLMTNHRGYTDAVQIRGLDHQRREVTRQFEVGAATFSIAAVEPGG